MGSKLYIMVCLLQEIKKICKLFCPSLSIVIKAAVHRTHPPHTQTTITRKDNTSTRPLGHTTHQVGDIRCCDADARRDKRGESGACGAVGGRIHFGTLHINHQETDGDEDLAQYQHRQRHPLALF